MRFIRIAYFGIELNASGRWYSFSLIIIRSSIGIQLTAAGQHYHHITRAWNVGCINDKRFADIELWIKSSDQTKIDKCHERSEQKERKKNRRRFLFKLAKWLNIADRVSFACDHTTKIPPSTKTNTPILLFL